MHVTQSNNRETAKEKGFDAELPSKHLSDELNLISGQIVDSAFRVHTGLGPGLLESVYQACMVHHLRMRGLKVETQVMLPVHFEGLRVDSGLRLDLLVEGSVIVELKAVTTMHPIFEAQLYTYLKLSGRRIGLLINFNVERIKSGITRIVF